MEKWIGVIIAAVFIVALGAILYTIFRNTINSTGDNIKDSMDNAISKADNDLNDTISPQHFQGVLDGFNSVMKSFK